MAGMKKQQGNNKRNHGWQMVFDANQDCPLAEGMSIPMIDMKYMLAYGTIAVGSIVQRNGKYRKVAVNKHDRLILAECEKKETGNVRRI